MCEMGNFSIHLTLSHLKRDGKNVTGVKCWSLVVDNIFTLMIASPRIQVQTVSSGNQEPLHVALLTGVVSKLHV